MVSSVDNCPICLNALGDTIIDHEGTKLVTAVLHQTTAGLAHKVHRICIFQWFTEQLLNEPSGVRYDLTQLPFSCPTCRLPLSLKNCEEAAGVPLSQYIELNRWGKS